MSKTPAFTARPSVLPTAQYNLRIKEGTDTIVFIPPLVKRDKTALDLTGYTSWEVISPVKLTVVLIAPNKLQIQCASLDSIGAPLEFAYVVQARNTLAQVVSVIRGDSCVTEKLPV